MGRFIYICYSNSDEPIAREMCEYLEKKGLRCFFRHRDIPIDEQDNHMFEESSIDDSSCVVAIVSKGFIESERVKMINNNAEKCVIFAIEHIDMKKYGMEYVKRINAIKYPSRMFGHVLTEIKKYVGDTKGKKHVKCVIGSVMGVLFLLGIAYYTFTTNKFVTEEQNYPEYKDLSQTDFMEKEMIASQSPVLETELPFGRAQYGISRQDWKQCMKKMMDKAGLAMGEESERGFILPGDRISMELNTSKNLSLVLEPAFNEKEELYALFTTIKRKEDMSKNIRPLLDEVLTEILGVSDKYSRYDKFRVLHEGGLTPFYCLIKNNELITIRTVDTNAIQIIYNNVPGTPKDIIEKDYLTFQFNKRNMH